MKKRNIYQNQSQELLHIFEDAGSNEKVMCVPMDYAKNDHLVMFCNGHGDILRKPFSVKSRQKASHTSMTRSSVPVASVVSKKSTSFLVVRMPTHLPKILSVRYEARVFWLPMLMRMTPKRSVGMSKPALIESIY